AEQITVSINAMDASSLGVDDSGGAAATTGGDASVIGGLDVSSNATAATDAVATIDGAIKLVSDERAKLGAVQNRLEHTINNLGTSAQNLT
ncbi:flagellin, partial [Micrococcus sp. SIMBA_131]